MIALSMHDMVVAALHVIAVVAGLVWLGLQLVTSREAEPAPVDADEGRWYWLRWCAMIAFLAVWGIVAVRSSRGVPFHEPSMMLLMTSVTIVCVQWFHVWFVAWPSIRTGGERARRRAAAALAVNRATTIPLVFFFVATSWAVELGGEHRWIPALYWMVTAGIYGGLSGMALVLPKMTSRVLRPWPVALLVGAALPLTLRLL